jgi:hypothetical protein
MEVVYMQILLTLVLGEGQRSALHAIYFQEGITLKLRNYSLSCNEIRRIQILSKIFTAHCLKTHGYFMC